MCTTQALHSLNSQKGGLAAEKACFDRGEEVANDLHKVLKGLTSKHDGPFFAGGHSSTACCSQIS